MPGDAKLLVMLATYNEVGNVRHVYAKVREAVPGAHILFVDDNSPDGTGREIDRIIEGDSGVSVLHRPGKMGVGSAHRDGITWGYDHGFATIIAMDCDMLHSPDHLPDLLATDPAAAVVVGSRFLSGDSMPGWQLHRRLLTHTAHVMTRYCLGLPYDATGSFRRYDLTVIPRQFLDLVKSDGYAFFFESLHILHLNGIAIDHVPVVLLARTSGVSKMRLRDMLNSARVLMRQIFRATFRRHDMLISRNGRSVRS